MIVVCALHRYYIVGMSEELGGQQACDQLVQVVAEITNYRSLNPPMSASSLFEQVAASVSPEARASVRKQTQDLLILCVYVCSCVLAFPPIYPLVRHARATCPARPPCPAHPACPFARPVWPARPTLCPTHLSLRPACPACLLGLSGPPDSMVRPATPPGPAARPGSATRPGPPASLHSGRMRGRLGVGTNTGGGFALERCRRIAFVDLAA